MIVFRRINYFFKISWLFIRHSFVKDKLEFWSWCFQLAKDKNGKWFNDKSLVFFLLDSAINFENNDRLCKIYSNFKSTFQDEVFFNRHIDKMQKACRTQSSPNVEPIELSNNRKNN